MENLEQIRDELGENAVQWMKKLYESEGGKLDKTYSRD